MSSSRGSYQPRDQTTSLVSPALAGGFFTTSTTCEAHYLRPAAATAKSLQSCLTLCDPIDGSPPGSPIPGIHPGKNTGVGCHFLLQCMKVKSESEVVQLCPTLSNPMDCSPPPSIEFSRQEYWGGVPLPSLGTAHSRCSNTCRMNRCMAIPANV